MSLKFKLMSVIFALILAIIVTLSVFTLTRPNQDILVSTAMFAVIIISAATFITFLFARSVARQITGAAYALSYFSADEDGLTGQITDNPKDEADALGGTITNIQSATTTLAKNNVSVIGFIESYEDGLTGMQDVVDDLREIVHSIDNVLLKSEAIDPGRRGAA